MVLSERVQQVRRVLSLTQKEFGELLDLTEADVGGIEHGRRGLNRSRERFLRALEVAAANHPAEVVYPRAKACYDPHLRQVVYDPDTTARLATIFELAGAADRRAA